MFISDAERLSLRIALVDYLNQNCRKQAFDHTVFEVNLDEYQAIRWLLHDLFDDTGLDLSKLDQGRRDVGLLFGHPVFWNGWSGPCALPN